MRLIAVDPYGEAGVAEEWRSDGSMRGRVRWRVRMVPPACVSGGRIREGVDISLPVSAAGWLTVLPSLTGETP